MAALSITAKNVSATQDQGAVIRNYEAAAALTVGQLVYLNSSGKVDKADANLSLEASRAIGIVVAGANTYDETTIAAGSRCSVCVFGPVYGFASLTPGTYGWVGTTAGEIVDAAPTTAYVYVVGQAVDADTFFVQPGISSPASV